LSDDWIQKVSGEDPEETSPLVAQLAREREKREAEKAVKQKPPQLKLPTYAGEHTAGEIDQANKDVKKYKQMKDSGENISDRDWKEYARASKIIQPRIGLVPHRSGQITGGRHGSTRMIQVKMLAGETENSPSFKGRADHVAAEYDKYAVDDVGEKLKGAAAAKAVALGKKDRETREKNWLASRARQYRNKKPIKIASLQETKTSNYLIRQDGLKKELVMENQNLRDVIERVIKERTKRDSPDRVAGRDAGGRRVKSLEEEPDENLEEQEISDAKQDGANIPDVKPGGINIPDSSPTQPQSTPTSTPGGTSPPGPVAEEENIKRSFNEQKEDMLFEALMKKWCK